jgi:hypothetical protein
VGRATRLSVDPDAHVDQAMEAPLDETNKMLGLLEGAR